MRAAHLLADVGDPPVVDEVEETSPSGLVAGLPSTSVVKMRRAISSSGGEQADRVCCAASLARSRRVGPLGSSASAGSAHRARHVDARAAPAPACAGPPSGRAARSSRRARAPRAASSAGRGRRRWRRRPGRRRRPSGLAGPEAELEHPLLVLGLADEVGEAAGALGLVGVDPVGLEHEERVVAEERALLRVDGDERDAGRAGLLAGLEDRRRGCRRCSRAPTSPRRRRPTRT